MKYKYEINGVANYIEDVEKYEKIGDYHLFHLSSHQEGKFIVGPAEISEVAPDEPEDTFTPREI